MLTSDTRHVTSVFSVLSVPSVRDHLRALRGDGTAHGARRTAYGGKDQETIFVFFVDFVVNLVFASSEALLTSQRGPVNRSALRDLRREVFLTSDIRHLTSGFSSPQAKRSSSEAILTS
jgi:hypothetical protein